MILNSKGIIRQFDLVIYPLDFVVVIGAKLKDEVEKEYKPAEPEYVGFNPPTYEHPAATFNVVQKSTYKPCVMIGVSSLEDCKGSFFCHEVTHAALELYKFIGAEVDVENQEPFAYLTGNLFRLLNGAFYELRDYKPEKLKTKKK